MYWYTRDNNIYRKENQICFWRITLYIYEIKKLSLRELANLTNINHKTIYNLENDIAKEKNITIETVLKLANFFNVSIDDLVNRDLENVPSGGTLERN